jgi:hypothetical protein
VQRVASDGIGWHRVASDGIGWHRGGKRGCRALLGASEHSGLARWLALGSGVIGWRLCGLAGLELGPESFDVAGVLAQLGIGGSLADAG